MGKPQLFLLHFAGGNYYSFRFMTPLLKKLEVVPLELPGRGKRSNELLLKDFDSAVSDLVQQITKLRNGSPCMLFGHSMGAYLALGIVIRMEIMHQSPAFLFVSGSAGPGVNMGRSWHSLEDRHLIQELTDLGGMPPGFCEDPELMNYYLPILRADFEVVEKNALDDCIVNVPIYAMMGDKEENVDSITNWEKFTKSSFSFKIFNGDHFFIHSYPQSIVDIIEKCYDSLQ
ncbi:MAG: alpha/beta fold hydrolase [Chitinophagaceae bacterium]|nr:alpha/beta fold hydrolase [Chitinophagaceae bacterium]